MNWRGWALAGVTLALAALAVFGVGQLIQRAPIQILTLPNGMQYRFAGVTYGTNHVMESRLSALTSRLPGPVEKLTRKLLGNRLGQRQSRESATPSIVVWFKPVGTSVGVGIPAISVMALLADENGVASGEREDVSWWSGALSPMFKAWPRRSRTLECVLFQYNYGNGQVERCKELGRFRFRNPTYGQFPQWTPEPLPATKPAGDIDVTLHAFLSGVGWDRQVSRQGDKRSYCYEAVEPGEEPRAAVRFTVDSPCGTNESWSAAQFFLSDAPGNDLKATSWSHSIGRPAHFSPVFWPGEEAWKLTARFKRKTGFPESDSLVFRDVPLPKVGRTNEVLLTNAVKEVECVLESIVLRPPMTSDSYSSRDLTIIHLQHVDLPDDVAVDLVSVTFDDPAAEVESAGSSWGGSYYDSEFTAFPTNQTRASITYAIQQTREVQFMVPPNWVYSTNTVEIELGEN